MKRLGVVLLVLIVSLAAQAAPIPVVVSTSLAIEGFPNRVLPSADDSMSVDLSNLKVERLDSGISGTVRLAVRKGQPGEFKLLCYFASAGQLLLAVWSPQARRVFVTPAGSMWNTVLSPSGYTLADSAGAVVANPPQKGDTASLAFSIPYALPGTFDLSGFKGKLFVFLVGESDEVPVKGDAIVSLSNVLEIDL